MKLEYRIDQARAEAAHGYTEKALTSLRHIVARPPNGRHDCQLDIPLLTHLSASIRAALHHLRR